MSAEIATEHPHIVRRPGTCGGSPLIRGTRITVRFVAQMWKGGDTAEDIVRAYPHLQASWIYDAISITWITKLRLSRRLQKTALRTWYSEPEP